jgi:uncharacterized membrane protein
LENNSCYINRKKYPAHQLRLGSSLRKNILEMIRKEHPDFSGESYISSEELNKYRRRYLEDLIKKESREVSALEKEVVESITKHELVSQNIEPDIEQVETFGQRIADKVADFGGSWTFIIIFFSLLFTWIGINIILLTKAFDPYPFILLNLILSCLASIQAPIIMMSQNRKEDKDRKRSEHDYKVNLKAELEIRLLHEKIDHMIVFQNQRLIEIQELQTDYLEDISKEIKAKR